MSTAPGGSILEVERVSKRFGGVQAVVDVSFSMGSGQICGLIGPNGAGKTTLFNLVSGVYRPDAGVIRIAGRRADELPAHRIARLGVARTFQNLQLFDTLTARENVMVGLAQAAPPSLGSSLLTLSRRRAQESRDRAVADQVLDRVGLGGAGSRTARELSFGEQRLLEIARALATSPRLLLLDEPASGLSRGEVSRLVTLLRDLHAGGLGIFLIEHDVATVLAIADHVVVLDQGRKLAEGPPVVIQSAPAVIEAYLGEERTGNGVSARGDSGQARRPLLDVEDLVAFRGELQVLRGVTLQVSEGEVTSVIGPNGAGKSTLLGTLAGLFRRQGGGVRLQGQPLGVEPAERVARRGISLVPERRQVFPGLSVRQNLLLGAYARRAPAPELEAGLARVFELFPRLRELQDARAGSLSGGEQQMLAIGRGLMARPTLLMLDEPSLGLAPRLVREIFHVLGRLKAAGSSILVVEQNARAVFEIADHVAVLERGELVMRGVPRELVDDPRVVEAYLGGPRRGTPGVPPA